MGLPLIRIKDVRHLFGLAQSADYEVSLSSSLHLRQPPTSHVIAVRITSEDPDEGFKPRSGDLFELNFKSSRSVWGYFSVGSVGGIHEFADIIVSKKKKYLIQCFQKKDRRKNF